MTENTENKEQSKPQSSFEQKSTRGFTKRVLKKETVVFIAVLIFLVLMGFSAGKIESWINNWRADRYERVMQKYIEEAKMQHAAERSETKTPEEAIELFVVALKAGDIEKASKYYVAGKQKTVFDDLKNELSKYGDLHLRLEYFTEVLTKGTKKCNEQGDKCTFEYAHATTEGTTTESVSVERNSSSGFWEVMLP